MIGFIRERYKKRKEIIRKYFGEIVTSSLLCVCSYVLSITFNVGDEIKNVILGS